MEPIDRLALLESISHRVDRLRAIDLARGFPFATVVVDTEGVVLMFNPMAELLTGFTSAEIVGNPVENLIPERFRGRHPEYRDHYQQDPVPRSMGVGQNLALFILRRERQGVIKEVPVAISLNAVPTPDGTCTVVVIQRRADSGAQSAG